MKYPTSYFAVFLVSICLLCISACQKKDDTVPTPSDVSIDISAPANGQIFHKGDTVKINAKVSYTTELHGYVYSLTDSATKTVLSSNSSHLHNDHFEISDTWVDTFSKAAVLQLTIQTVLNHEGDEKSKTIFIQTQP